DGRHKIPPYDQESNRSALRPAVDERIATSRRDSSRSWRRNERQAWLTPQIEDPPLHATDGCHLRIERQLRRLCSPSRGLPIGRHPSFFAAGLPRKIARRRPRGGQQPNEVGSLAEYTVYELLPADLTLFWADAVGSRE